MLTSLRPPSAVPMMLLARLALSMAVRDAGLLGLEVFAGDQACRIIGAAVDLQTRAQPLQAGVQVALLFFPASLSDQRADVGVNSAHGHVSP